VGGASNRPLPRGSLRTPKGVCFVYGRRPARASDAIFAPTKNCPSAPVPHEFLVGRRMATTASNDPNAAALAAEPVHLTFEVGELTFAAGELAQLDPGFVFPLRAPLARPVVVKANGVRFGVGELVEIDGALAVRLIEGDGDGT